MPPRAARPLHADHVPPLNADITWRHELADMALRGRLGGIFYLAGWITVGLSAGTPYRHPVLFAMGLLVFIVLALLRLRRPPPDLDAIGARRWIGGLWLIVWASTGLWSIGGAWVLFTSDVMTARVLVLVLIGAFGTTLSHVYAMRAKNAGGALALLFVPQLAVLFARQEEWLLGVSFLIYFVYLLLVMRRARGEYWQRVALEEEIREQRDFFEQQSRRDGLTGLSNRRRLDATLASLLGNRKDARVTPDVALILFDLDHFKTINDRFGHAVGDSCLVEFARCLTTVFDGPDELPARMGGEEFAVVLPCCGLAEARVRAERLRQTLAATPMPDTGTRVFMTVSGGVVSAEPGDTGDALLARADVALYHAKRSGRNRIVAGGTFDEATAAPVAAYRR